MVAIWFCWGPGMRPMILLLAMLGVAWWVACTFPGPCDEAARQGPDGDSWRRTIDGWECRDTWPSRVPGEPPVPHPGIVALWQVLMAVTIGVAALPARDGVAGGP